MSRSLANTLLLLAGLVWGMGFVAQQSAMESVGPMLFIGLRFVLAALVVSPFALREWQADRRGGRPVHFSVAQCSQVLLVGVAFFTAMSLQQVGLLATSVTNAGFLTGLYVVIVPILVLVVFRERQHWIVWPASLASVLGIYLLGGAGLSRLTWGDGLVIACAFFWAVQVTLIGKTVQRLGRPIQIATIQFAVCGVLGLVGHVVFAWLPHTQLIEPRFALEGIHKAALELFYAAVFAGGLAFSLQAVGQRYTREADAAILLSSEALFAGLFGACLLGERLGAIGYLGCAIIFAAIVAVQVAPLALRSEQPESGETESQPTGRSKRIHAEAT
jgi:drug/metabolite transporter (DMT)-like permease